MKTPRLKSLSIIGFTIILVIVPFCMYYLFFVSSQRSYFSKRNFRVLAEIGDHISSKIDTMAANLVNVAKKAKQDKTDTTRVEGKPVPKKVDDSKTGTTRVEGKRAPKKVDDSENVKHAVNLVPDLKYDPVQFKAIPNEQTKLIQKRPISLPASNANTSTAASSNRRSRPPLANANTTTEATSNPTPGPPPPAPNPRHAVATRKLRPSTAAPAPERSSAPSVTLSVKPEEGAFWLYLEYRGASSALLGDFPVKSDINKLFEPFVSRFVIDELNESKERLFDEVLVVEQESGRVIFERGQTGLNVVTLDSLSNDKGGKFELQLSDQSSSLFEVGLAGSHYELFLQPLRLALSANGDQKNQGIRWVVCGLTRADHFRDETYTVSYTIVIFFVFVVLLSFLSWPLLKLRLMGPKDRLRRSDLAVTLFSALMGTALVTFLVMDLHTYVSLEEKTDGQLKELSTAIRRNFKDELGSVLAQMGELNQRINDLPRTEPLSALKDLDASKEKKPLDSKTTGGVQPQLLGKANILDGTINWETAPYPYFNTASWADTTGLQRIKWTTRSDTTAFVDVSTRQFFTDTRDDKLWKLNRNGQSLEYSLELLNSKTTGENIALVATKVPNSPWVSSMETKLLSLMGTVLPAGYGYAIIESGGKVLFHSDEVKNLKENFFEECENDRSLRAAVLARSNRLVHVSYLGKGHRLFVSPLDSTPWVLVTFRDKQIARTMNLELLSVSLFLYLIFALILLTVVSIICFLMRGERLGWLWPDPARAGRYERLITIELLLGVGFLLLLQVKNEWVQITSCLVIPLLATVLAVFVLKDGSMEKTAEQGSGFFGRTLFSYRTGYAMMLAGLLALLTVLPAAGFFQVARAFEMTLLVKHGQVSLARSLEQRDQRVRSQYKTTQIGAQADNDAAKAAFLKRRLDPESNGYSWDVYDSFFFNTTRAGARVADSRYVNEELGKVDLLLAGIRPLYNQSCVESNELSHGASEDLLWSWGLDREGNIRLKKDRDGRIGESSQILASSIPAIVAPDSFLKWLGVTAAFALLLMLVYVLVRFVSRYFFVLDLDTPRPLWSGQSALSSTGNLVLLRSAMSVDVEGWDAQQYHRIDMRQVKNWPDLSSEIKPGDSASSLSIVLDHFEHCMDDPVATREKLLAIERLLSENRRVLIVSTEDPLLFSFTTNGAGSNQRANGAAENTALSIPAVTNGKEATEAGNSNLPSRQIDISVTYAQARWSAAFTTFATVYATEKSTAEFAKANTGYLSILKTKQPWRYIETIGKQIANGTAQGARFRDRATAEEMLNQVVEQARAYHAAIWSTCSQDERCALIHLAQDGMINAKNADLRRLMKRGLVVRDPSLRLMDESFRRFVLSVSNFEDIEAWRKEGGGSPWQLMRGPLLIVLLSVALFLFITQKDVYDSTISFMSALTAGIAVMFKLLGMFQKGKGESSVQS